MKNTNETTKCPALSMVFENSRFETKSRVTEVRELDADTFDDLVVAAAIDIDERVNHSWYDVGEMTNSVVFRAWVRDNLISS